MPSSPRACFFLQSHTRPTASPSTPYPFSTVVCVPKLPHPDVFTVIPIPPHFQSKIPITHGFRPSSVLFVRGFYFLSPLFSCQKNFFFCFFPLSSLPHLLLLAHTSPPTPPPVYARYPCYLTPSFSNNPKCRSTPAPFLLCFCTFTLATVKPGMCHPPVLPVGFSVPGLHCLFTPCRDRPAP